MDTLAHPDATQQIEEYKEHLNEIGRSPNTLKAYIRDLTDFSEFTREPLWPAPSNLESQIQRWLAYRRSQGDGLVSIRRRIFSVKSYYHYAGMPQLLTSVVTPKSQWYVPKIISNADVERLMAELAHIGPESYDFFKLILLLGFRFNELYNINVSDSDIRNRKVTVVNDRGLTRQVIIGDTTASIFEEFLNRGGKWVQSPSQLMRTIEVVGVIAGVRNATSHSLRATCAARMLAAGHKRQFVKTNMGYLSDTTMNMISQVSKRDLVDEFRF